MAVRMLLSALAGLMVNLLAAQPISEDSRVRLATPSEGEAIVQAAWELRHGLDPKPDCSHFVHEIYAQAGFDYEYAQSAAIFDGIDSFRRVKVPQAGDLIVWQGHVGIVVDPLQRSFFSSVLSGFAIENYHSNYWLSRGEPRFYRYLVDDARLVPTVVHPDVYPDVAHAYPDVAHALSESGREINREGPWRKPADETANGEADVDLNDTETRDVVFVSARRKPSKDEVLSAILRSVDAKGKRLIQGLRLESQPTVIVVDYFSVVDLAITENSGWAELEVNQSASFHFGIAAPDSLSDTWRVSLRRQEQGWVLFLPQDRIYLRHNVAMLVVSRRLAALSRSPVNNQERKKVTQILDELQSETDTVQGAGGSR